MRQSSENPAALTLIGDEAIRSFNGHRNLFQLTLGDSGFGDNSLQHVLDGPRLFHLRLIGQVSVKGSHRRQTKAAGFAVSVGSRPIGSPRAAFRYSHRLTRIPQCRIYSRLSHSFLPPQRSKESRDHLVLQTLSATTTSDCSIRSSKTWE